MDAYNKERKVAETVSYQREGQIGRIVFEDGKANVMSIAMLSALHKAFDKAEKDKTAVFLSSRGRHFSAGFDLAVFANGTAQQNYTLLKSGAELALRILSFPRPVVTACQGNAYPMGAFLLLASDYRIGAEGAFHIRLNELAIGLTVPRFAVELARQRLSPSHFNRTVVTGEMFTPREAVAAGFLDRLVPVADLERAASEAATALTRIHPEHHFATKQRARGPVIAAIRRVIDEDITLQYAEARVASRKSA
jgi:enoyl-CoA hydratase